MNALRRPPSAKILERRLVERRSHDVESEFIVTDQYAALERSTGQPAPKVHPATPVGL
jgi:hypothetical protein